MDRGVAARTCAGALAVFSLLVAGGCSGPAASQDSSGSPDTTAGSATPLPTDSSAPTVSAQGSTAAVIGPIVVEPTQTDVVATVGRFLDFNVGPNPGEWKISSANEAVVGELMQGGERDGATYNPAAKALSVGSATVTLENSAGLEALVFKVQVTE